MSVEHDALTNIFEERAENLSREELIGWSSQSKRDREILAALKGPGAKLLIGPRGSGKSTYLRRAYFELAEEGKALPAYVNFSRSLALEPLFHQRADALRIFRQWVVQKIIIGVVGGLRDCKITIKKSLVEKERHANEFVESLQKGDEPPDSQEFLAPSQLLTWLEEIGDRYKRRRVVLLLDDAAHAFSAEQQREFFEIYRELRSRQVAGKAAVYPGITSYSPHFHVGHEAKLVQAWIDPNHQGYLELMKDIINRRFPADMIAVLNKSPSLVDYLSVASFGLPRSFLFMLSQLLGIEEVEKNSSPTKRLARKTVEDNTNSLRSVFRALAHKLPRHKNFIQEGSLLETAMAQSLRRFNKNQRDKKKAVVVAFPRPIEPELDRMLSFLEYAGVIRKLDPLTRGKKGTYERYVIHFSILISENSLSLGKNPSIEKTTTALTTRDAHAFVQVRGATLLGKDFETKCTLDLAPCPKCKSPRISEEALFCMKCGNQLSEASVYKELLQAPIDKLPLTVAKLRGLQKHTNIETVQDILLDEELKQIRSVPYVGAVWASRIRTYAEEYVSV